MFKNGITFQSWCIHIMMWMKTETFYNMRKLRKMGDGDLIQPERMTVQVEGGYQVHSRERLQGGRDGEGGVWLCAENSIWENQWGSI